MLGEETPTRFKTENNQQTDFNPPIRVSSSEDKKDTLTALLKMYSDKNFSLTQPADICKVKNKS